MKKILSVALGLAITAILQAQISLPRLVSNGMVLQRDMPLKIWGWAAPAGQVMVRFRGEGYKTVTGPDRHWSVTLPPAGAGGPYTMEIEGSNRVIISDILVGDVWVCAGQSNMDLPMERVKEKYPDVIAQSANPLIRYFSLATRYDFRAPQDDLPSGRWEAATPGTVLQFSATGYFFAKALFERYHVPIGLVRTSIGGAPAEAWLSEEGLKEFPDHLSRALQCRDSNYVDSIQRRDKAISREWYNHIRQQDQGFQGEKPWYDPGYDASSWATMTLPGFWEDQGLKAVNGVVWFRKEIDVPVSMAGAPAKLLLGRIVDLDSVYVNGVFAGTTGYQYPPRRYALPSGLLKGGKNCIVVRVINSAGRGGFAPGKPYELKGEAGQVIDLKGQWHYKVGAVTNPLLSGTAFQYQPLGLFNGMIAPLLPYSIKGVIWYQGESNTGRPGEYNRLFPAVIADWRRAWGEGDFPFLYVQLANFMEPVDQPSESGWAELREAQRKTLTVPNTGMAVAIDIGEWNDLHPLNKGDVGKRLALAAQRVAYGEKDVVYTGPLYQSMKVEDSRIRISFAHTNPSGKMSDLVARGGGELKYFSIAGEDRKYYWANAKIEGMDVVVWNDEIAHPAAVRYGWASNPEGANLYNRAGLPASPFQTDGADMPPLPPPVQLTAEQDHRRMMGLLHIDSLRRGPSGNPKAPDAANTDESKATPYTSLPDPLVLKNGNQVKTAKAWWAQRRPEIMEDFDMEIYGRVPGNTPKVNWELISMIRDTNGNIPVITKKLAGHVDNSAYPLLKVDIQLELTTPADAAGPVPVIMEFGFIFPPGVKPPSPPPGTPAQNGPSWQQQLLAKGWGYASIIPTSYQADNGAGLTQGIIGLVNKGQPRKPDDWGALRAWAWGASRALDYFETDSAVDAKQVGIEGLSRYGKAAIVAMAYEPRFAIAFIGSSGEGGVKIHRRRFGEQVENVASSGEYHWMAGNFLKYAGPLTPNDLPVDAHELIALCAPRPVFISSGSPLVEGNWVDAKGMFLGGVGAGPVYKLLGKKDLGTDQLPFMETALTDGEIAFRQHSGGHTTGPNWPTFLQFASRYLKVSSAN